MAGAGLNRLTRQGGVRTLSVVCLAEVVVLAFSRFEQRSVVARWQLWLGAVMALWLYERRVHWSGKSLCLLGLRRGRAAIAVAALVVLTGVLGVISVVLAVGFLTLNLLVFLPLAWNGLREIPARLRLAAVTPAGRHLYVHSFASTRRGAGAELLGGLCSEADSSNTPLVLDVEAPRLVQYYRAFGFRTCGGPVRFPDGHELQRMWRPPARAWGEPFRAELPRSSREGGSGAPATCP